MMFSHKSKLHKKKARGNLSIDTTCAVQKKVFPYESRVPELKFVSYSESHARVATSKEQLDNNTPVHPGAEQSVSLGLQGHVPSVRSQRGAIVATPGVDNEETTLALPYHKRLFTKRPEPLKLGQDGANLDVRQGASTPVIVITPARNEFHGAQTLQVNGRRPASSVYSRYTNCITTSSAPPVPPLPFMGEESAGLKSRFSTVTATTTFEDVSPVEPAERPRTAQTPGLPTPRRSKGWWNVLSPFSAKSVRPAFWRTPSPSSDCTPVLQDAATMGHADPYVADHLGNGSSRSAPIDGVLDRMIEKLPRRSLTAPAELRTESKGFDMYYIASTGLAAAYFDVARRFPSLYQPEVDEKRDLGDWSPSQSVHLPPLKSLTTNNSARDSTAVESEDAISGTDLGIRRTRAAEEQPSSQPSNALRAAVFSTPSADELRTPPVLKKTPVRTMTGTTSISVSAPLSEIPEVHQAHLGMPVGPESSFGEQRQVAVSRTPIPTALKEMVVDSKHTSSAQELPSAFNVARFRPTHTRQDSYGLGISDEKNELFPPPICVEERPRLGTDRFGQLTIRSVGDETPPRPWYHRHFWLLAFLVAAMLVLLIILLVLFVPQRHHDVGIQASWLNLTGLPAIPIGISTIIQPKTATSRDSCTEASIWTCSAPAGSSTADFPDFRLAIRFKNGTSGKHRKRSVWQDHIYTALPSPSSRSDQVYLGRTTDNISEPYNGEKTPFYISLLDAKSLDSGSRLHKRSSNFSYPYPVSSNTTNAQANAETLGPSKIPNAVAKSNGQSSDPVLYPHVTAQPLRLYNRGQDTEHYGFYSYFDRSIYISSTDRSSPWNATSNITSNVPLQDASAVCTFSQTRLLVQIWTRRGTMEAANLSTSTDSRLVAKASCANDMSAPGSFPYPVSITIDRHGGLAGKKGVYCYALDPAGKIDGGVKAWVMENRGSGGTLLDGAEVPGDEHEGSNLREREENVDDDDDDQKEEKGEGIDGGTGGCLCQWKHE